MKYPKLSKFKIYTKNVNLVILNIETIICLIYLLILVVLLI
jgi:hypothetical protein